MMDMLQKKLELKHGHSHFKSAYGINFGLWEVVRLKLHQLRQVA